MGKFLKFSSASIVLLLVLLFGCSHPRMTVHNYDEIEITVIFLDQGDSYRYIRDSDFAVGMNRLNISIRTDVDSPGTNREEELSLYNNFIFENLKDWCGYERNVMWGATEEVIDELKIFAPAVLPDTLFFIQTSMSLEFNAFFTINNAICVPSSIIWPLVFNGMLEDFVAHELFHIYSRYHKNKRDSLYTLFNFHAADTVITGPLLKSKMIRNPDVHSDNYVLQIKDSTGVTKNLLLVVELDEMDYNDSRGITSFLGGANIFGFFDPYLYELEQVGENSFKVINEEDLSSLDWRQFENTLESMYGSFAEEWYFAEEIAADTFMFALNANKDKALLEKLSPQDLKRIDKFLRLLKVN